MNSHHLSTTHHVSRVDAPCLLHGGIGLCLGVGMLMAGMFHSGDAQLMKVLLQPVFHGQEPRELPVMLQVLLSVICSFGLAFVVLDSAGTWRRIVLGVTAVVVILAMVPTLAVWNIYFSPFLPVVTVFWVWFFCMMYVRHHLMPCEVGRHAAAPQSILTVSSAYKQPAVAVLNEEVAPVMASQAKVKVDLPAANPTLTPKLAPEEIHPTGDDDPELLKYRPKEIRKEKVSG